MSDETVMQPPPGGWPNRRREDVRISAQADQILELQTALKAALSKHADYENNQEWMTNRRKKDWEVLVIIGTLLSVGFGVAIYQGSFAKAEALEKTQAKVTEQDLHITKVEDKVDALKETITQGNKEILRALKDAGPQRRR
jgi:hypothetical protein